MAGMRLPPNNIACPWVGDIVSPCPLPKGKVPCVGIALTSHLLSLASRTVTVGSRCLKARLYGWLPLSNAYGIFSLAPQHIDQTPTAFLPLQHKSFYTLLSWNLTSVILFVYLNPPSVRLVYGMGVG